MSRPIISQIANPVNEAKRPQTLENKGFPVNIYTPCSFLYTTDFYHNTATVMLLFYSFFFFSLNILRIQHHIFILRRESVSHINLSTRLKTLSSGIRIQFRKLQKKIMYIPITQKEVSLRFVLMEEKQTLPSI